MKRNSIWCFLGLFAIASAAWPALAADTYTPPSPQKVVVVVLENQDYQEIVGDTGNAPFLNSVIAHGLLVNNAHAIDHPSQPNYLALFSGMEKLMKVLEAERSAPENAAPSLAASKHWDYILKTQDYNSRSGNFTNGGLLLQDNNFLTIDSPAVAAAYLKTFGDLAAPGHSVSHTHGTPGTPTTVKVGGIRFTIFSAMPNSGGLMKSSAELIHNAGAVIDSSFGDGS